MKYRIMYWDIDQLKFRLLTYPNVTMAPYIKDIYYDINEAYSHMNARINSSSGGRAGVEYLIEEISE